MKNYNVKKIIETHDTILETFRDTKIRAKEIKQVGEHNWNINQTIKNEREEAEIKFYSKQKQKILCN